MEKNIFRNYPKGGDVFRTRIFVSCNGNIVRLNTRTLPANDFDMMTGKGSTCKSEDRQGFTFDEVNENDWKRIFKDLALGNPEDFKTLYYLLKKNNSELFPIIKSTLEEIQSEFNFE